MVSFAGTYKWVEKKGISQCDVDLQFKTNKFDSNITGYIVLKDGSASANIHIQYKFEKNNTEILKFDFSYHDKSTKISTLLSANLRLESSFYPEINFDIATKYLVTRIICLVRITASIFFFTKIRMVFQKSHDRFDAIVDFTSNPFVADDRLKSKVQFVFSYFRSYNGLKLNTHLQITKPITDVNVKFGLSHQSHPGGSTSTALVRYAKGTSINQLSLAGVEFYTWSLFWIADKDIVVRLDIHCPQEKQFHYELKLNMTLPAVQQPMIVQVRILGKDENEYNVSRSFAATYRISWF